MVDVSPNGVAEKAADDLALKRTVQQPPPWQGPLTQDTFIYWMGGQASEITPWGSAVKARDRQLREFIPSEPYFTSALGIVAARNAAFSWVIEGPDAAVEKAQTVLANANFGQGWPSFIERLTLDLSTQDNGAFVEIIREADSASAPLVGIANLDAARCFHTGLPEVPVLYLDRAGEYHYLKWYQVATFADMPATVEGLPGVQYCALTRLMRNALILRDVGVYLQEKIGGRYSKAVTLVKGVTPEAIEKAFAASQVKLDAAGLSRFSLPLFIGSVNPNADIGFETLEIASLPDGFDLDLSIKQYIAQIAMAFMSDYQEFAPLSSGNLGSGQQSETLHAKARGKGPGLFMKLISQAMNFSVLPANVEFKFEEQDLEADAQVATAQYTRAQGRDVRIKNGEINVQVARQLALQVGDLTPEQVEELERADAEAKREAEANAQALAQQNPPPAPGDNQNEPQVLDDNTDAEAQTDRNGTQVNENQKADAAIPRARTQVEEEIAKRIGGTFEELWKELKDTVAA